MKIDSCVAQSLVLCKEGNKVVCRVETEDPHWHKQFDLDGQKTASMMRGQHFFSLHI